MSASTMTSAKTLHPDAIPDSWWTDTLHAYSWQPDGATHNPLAPDAYAERAWLPLIGPTAFLAARRLLYSLTEADTGTIAWPVARFASHLGVGVPALRNAIRRLERMRLVHIDGDRLAVHQLWPDLTARQQSRLPQRLP